MKIAVVTPLLPTSLEPDNGIFIYRTLRELVRLADLQVFCLQSRTPGSAAPDPDYSPPDLKITYVQYAALPVVTRLANGYMAGRAIYSHLRDAQPDVILAYWIYPEGFGAVRCGNRLGVPVVLGSRGSDLRHSKGRVGRRLTSLAIQSADAILTVSNDLRAAAIAHGADPAWTTTVYNGCDSATFQPRSRSEAREKLGIATEDELVLFVGRLVSSKGLRELLQAASALGKEHPRLRLVLVGQGPLESELRERTVAAGLGKVVVFAGRLPAPEIAQWMAACDLLCLPSYSEGCPNVVVEALSCGRPVVGTDVGGIPELLRPETGILVAPRDAAALTGGIHGALSAKWDSEAIQKTVARSWSTAAHETLDALERVIRLRGSK